MVSYIRPSLKRLEEFFAKHPHLKEVKEQSPVTHMEDQLDAADLQLIKTYRRIFKLCADHEHAVRLIDAGYTSAHQISSHAKRNFLHSVKDILPENIASQLHTRSRGIEATVSQMVASIKSVMSGSYNGMHANNISEKLTGYIKAIPGYADFFGDQDYCDCNEFSSIFGPAAYLTDLLRIIDLGVMVVNPSLEANKLSKIRPDIYEIPLTADQATDEVDYLAIVNKVLITQLSVKTSVSDPYLKLATNLYPFQAPYNSYLDEIRINLQSLELSLVDIYSAFDKPEKLNIATAREYLCLTIEQLENILKPKNLASYVSKNYGRKISAGKLQNLDQFNVFLSVTGLTSTEAIDLFNQGLSFQELFDVSGAWILSMEDSEASLTQHNNQLSGHFIVDKVNGMLSATLEWTYLDSTWVPVATGQWQGSGVDRAQEGNIQLIFNSDGKSLTGQYTTGLGLPWTGQMFSGTRAKQTTGDAGSIPGDFFINRAAGLTGGAYLQIYDKIVSDNVTRQISNISLNTLQTINRFVRLQRVLGWSFEQLDWMIKSLTLKSDSTDNLSEQMVARLSMAKIIMDQGKVTPDEAAAMWYDLRTRGMGEGPVSVAPFDQIFNNATLLAQTDGQNYHPVMNDDDAWQNPLYTDQALPFVIDDIQYSLHPRDFAQTTLIRGEIIVSAIPANIPDIKKVAAALYGPVSFINLTVSNLSALFRHALLPQKLGIDVDEYLLLCKFCGLTDANGRFLKLQLEPEKLIDLISQLEWINNSGLSIYDIGFIINGTVTLQINPGYQIANIGQLMAAVKQANESVQVLLLFKTFDNLLAQFFNTSTDFMEQILPAAAVYCNMTIVDIMALFVKNETQVPEQVLSFIQVVARLLYCSQKLGISAVDLNTILGYPQAFEIAPNNREHFFKLQTVRSIYRFLYLKTLFNDQQNVLNTYIIKASALGTTEEELLQLMVALTGWTKTEVFNVSNVLWGTLKRCTEINEIWRFEKFINLISVTGQSVKFISQLNKLRNAVAAKNWELYHTLATATGQVVESQVPLLNTDTVTANVQALLNEHRRDVLSPTVIWQLGQDIPGIVNTRSLYEYLLIDVSMAGCASISPIKEALNASQLFLQRCRLNLQENLAIDIEEIPEIYWEWIMNYRIWEANREVFLYPENYLDATIRNTKTDLFTTLQNNLQQNSLTNDWVETCFRQYLDAFHTISSLQQIDAYQTSVTNAEGEKIDTLFLLARTTIAPYQYYYVARSGSQSTTWSNWQLIDLNINSAYATIVFCFNKLFIFWSELNTVQESDQITNQKETVTKITIYYSWLNFNGKWTSPQTVIKDQILIVKNPAFDGQIIFPATDFDPALTIWNRVNVVPISPSQIASGISTPRSADEQMVITYGPMYNIVFWSTIANPGQNPPIAIPASGISIAAQTFVKTLNTVLVNLRFMITGATVVYDYVPVYPPVILNKQLQHSRLLQSNELVSYALNGPNDTFTTFTAGVVNSNATSSALTLVPDGRAMFNNYVQGDTFNKISEFNPTREITDVIFNADPNFLGQVTGDDILPFMADPPFFAYYIQPGNSGVLQITTSPLALRVSDYVPLLNVGNTSQYANEVQGLITQNLIGSFGILSSELGTISVICEVKSQPGSFLIKVNQEYFLFESMNLSGGDPIAYNNFSSGVKVGNLVMPTITGSINFSQLTYSYQNLSQNGLLDFNFIVSRLSNTAFENLSNVLNIYGIDGLMSLPMQQPPVNIKQSFNSFKANPSVVPPPLLSGDQIDFEGIYGNYYWELYFHAPMLVAQLLTNQQQFQAAQKWLNYILNPTLSASILTAANFCADDLSAIYQKVFDALSNNPNALIDHNGQVTQQFDALTLTTLGDYLNNAPNNLQLDEFQIEEIYNVLAGHYLAVPTTLYWQFQPFRNYKLEKLADQLINPKEIACYNDDPFNPQAIAALRWGAYEKKIVMQYIDNLIRWGDNLFTQFTWESITTATMLYNYAYDLLGSKPTADAACSVPSPVSFNDIQAYYQNEGQHVPQFLISLEEMASKQGAISKTTPFNALNSYFCIPENNQLLNYWSTVEDRLYKIRNCMNIAGQKEQLALFQPPINPMILVRAAGSGNGIINSGNFTSPPVTFIYRFDVLINQAKSFTASVSSLGQKLAEALEKQDAQHLQILQITQGSALLSLTTAVKQSQILEMQNLISLWQLNVETAKDKINYYNGLLSGGINTKEATNLVLRATAAGLTTATIPIHLASLGGFLAPNIFGMADGGMKFGDAITTGATALDKTASAMADVAAILSTSNDYDRRNQEWNFQLMMATDELQTVIAQLNNAELQLTSAQQEMAVHLKNIELTMKEQNYLNDHFTSESLYQWMVTRISAIYYQSYQLALNISLNAQVAYQLELNNQDEFISLDYWNAPNKGLLSGEILQFSLDQMQSSYLNKHIREMEVEKIVSLKQMFPAEFFNFIWGDAEGNKKGFFNFTLTEQLFDEDFPSFYQRKVKSISITIPALVGPYQTLNGTLLQNNNWLLLQPVQNGVQYLFDKTSNPSKAVDPGSAVVREGWQAGNQIAISKGVDDSGMFQLNFEDARYLPFEGTGAVSSWSLALPPERNRIDFSTISDILIKIRYTAKDGGQAFLTNAVREVYNGIRQDFTYTIISNQALAGKWANLFQPPATSGVKALPFIISTDYLVPSGVNLKLEKLDVIVLINDKNSVLKGKDFLKLVIGSRTGININFQGEDNQASVDLKSLTIDDNQEWSLQFNLAKCPSIIATGSGENIALDPTKLLNVVLILKYSLPMFS